MITKFARLEFKLFTKPSWVFQEFINFFSHNYIRIGRTRAKALQAVRRFARENRRGYAVPKSNAFALVKKSNKLDTNIIDWILLKSLAKRYLKPTD